jgi:uncharacterized protein (DUF1697 family)
MATNLSNINLFSYAAFLRGINVGGKRQIKMEALQIAFQSWGLENVATILNSGNILFDAHSNDALEVKQIITTGIQSNFGFDADVFVRTIEDLKTLAARDPFKGYSESTLMKLYVTLLNQKVLLKIAIPYQSPGKELKILLGFPYSAFRYHPNDDISGKGIWQRTYHPQLEYDHQNSGSISKEASIAFIYFFVEK